MNTILAAVDLSKNVNALLEQASSLAKATGAELVLATVEPNLPGSVGESASESEAAISSEFSNDVHELHDIAAKVAEQDINCRALILEGTPADQVIATANSVDADMIIIGSHGHSAIFDTLTGSASQEIIQNAERPVLLVPLKA